MTLNTAITPASRRWAKVRPWQVLSRADSSPLVNTGTSQHRYSDGQPTQTAGRSAWAPEAGPGP
jgi:hypothetical protein